MAPAPIRVGINGLGRIGRAALKVILDHPQLELGGVNDLVPTENLGYLLKFDTVYGRYHRAVKAEDGKLVIDGTKYEVTHEKDPAKLRWGERGCELVLECTGVFEKEEDLLKHIDAGAKQVILSAPAKTESIKTVVYGATPKEQLGHDGEPGKTLIMSCASCTTNCITPVVEVLARRIGVEKATMTTIHAYTVSQNIVDGPSKHFRRGRAGAQKLVPTTTGAAKATGKALPALKGKFDGVAVRAPVAAGSIADIVCLTSRDTSAAEINEIFRGESQSEQYQGVLGVSEEPLVSSDIVGDPRASIVDLEMTQVVGGNLVKIMSWYDNEWGYANQMIRQAVADAAQLAEGRMQRA